MSIPSIISNPDLKKRYGLMAFEKDASLCYYVPDEFKTMELCLEAFKKDKKNEFKKVIVETLIKLKNT